MDLPGYGTVPGEWDLRAGVQEYLGGVSESAAMGNWRLTSKGKEVFSMRKRLVNYPFAGGWRYGILGG